MCLGIVAAGLTGAAFASPGVAGAPDLGWVPDQAGLVLILDRAASSDPALFDALQRELFFATDVLPALEAVGTAGAVPAIVAATNCGGPSRVLTLLGPASEPPVQDSPQGKSARLPGGTLALGDPGLVTQALARAAAGPPPDRGPAWAVTALAHAPEGASIRGVINADWLHCSRGPDAPLDPRQGDSARSLAAIRSVAFWASLDSAVRFTMRTAVADGSAAEVLADDLATLIASQAAGGAPAEMQGALRGASVERSDSAVSFGIVLPPPAMKQLNRSVTAKRLLTWRSESERRERWEHAADVLAALGTSSGGRVADVGAGGGFYTVRLARLVGPRGRVFAVDIDPDSVTALRHRVERPYPWVEVIQGEADDPKLPAGALDAALIVNSYHEMTRDAAMLGSLWRALKSGGRLVLVEPYSPARRGEPRAAQVKDHVIAPELVEAELARVGFDVVRRTDGFVTEGETSEWLIVARRP